MPKKAQGSKVSLTYNASPPPKIPKRFQRTRDEWMREAQWVPVISSNVVGIMYDDSIATLYVGFNPSKSKPRVRVYAYRGLGPAFAEDIYNVSSMGGFVWQRLRNAGVNGTEVSDIPIPTWLMGFAQEGYLAPDVDDLPQPKVGVVGHQQNLK
jgi:hypothetical protein